MIPKLKLTPSQSLAFGVILYITVGFLLISLPFSQKVPVSWLDNLFTVVSSISTTGLTTLSVSNSYTSFGQVILVILFQIGGWGFMTVTSFFFIVVKKEFSENRVQILNTSYSLPKDFNIKKFIASTVYFTLVIEIIGTLLLWLFFSIQGVENSLWSAFFHTVSAFATAGFSLFNNSLSDFSTNIPVNLIISILCYLGAIGFIVLQDFYYNIRKKRKMTLTSKVIIYLTLILFVVGTLLVFFFEPSIQSNGFAERLTKAAFQVMTASTTAGFNTIDIGSMSRGVLFIIIMLMVIGASPSGTGGGIKTTSISALAGTVASIVKKRKSVVFLKHEIPLNRVLNAVAITATYFLVLSIGIIILLMTDSFTFEQTFFEAASALGTVGLSTGITGNLSAIGKIVIIILMYVGRVGPLSFGIALFGRSNKREKFAEDDLAT